MVDTQKSKVSPRSPDGNGASREYVLITGGSQGIGRAMAEECARRGLNLLIVALDQPILYQAVEDIRERYGVEIDCLPVDLTAANGPEQVVDWCRSQNYTVNVLINNAGFGRSGVFDHLELEEYLAMVRLNNQVLMEMTYRFLPLLRRQPSARILNMSSMEATLPIPYKSVYTGTKHFVYAFSLALREELKEANIQVSVLCPGPTVTNEDGMKRIQAQGWRARLLMRMPHEVAVPAIDGLLRGKAVIIPGRLPQALIVIAKFLPTPLKMTLLERIFRSFKT